MGGGDELPTHKALSSLPGLSLLMVIAGCGDEPNQPPPPKNLAAFDLVVHGPPRVESRVPGGSVTRFRLCGLVRRNSRWCRCYQRAIDSRPFES